MTDSQIFPGLGRISSDAGFVSLDACSDGHFRVGRDGVRHILTPADRRVEFIVFDDRTLAFVGSSMGYPAYYPVHDVYLERPVRAVVMDLDGTTVRSEPFWVWMIERATSSLLDDPGFHLEEADLPFVSGFSVSEHLEYCIRSTAWQDRRASPAVLFRAHVSRDGGNPRRSRQGRCVRAGARPEGVSAGVEIRRHQDRRGHRACMRKPGQSWWRPSHDGPWRPACVLRRHDHRRRCGPANRARLENCRRSRIRVGAEACRVGLGILLRPASTWLACDSGAGVQPPSGRLPTIGMAYGNIVDSGTPSLCQHYCASFDDVLVIL